MKKLILTLILTFFAVGCSNNQMTYKPIELSSPSLDAEIIIDKTSLVVNENIVSNQVILNVKQLKELNNSVMYHIELSSPNKELIYFLYNNENTTNITTRPFAHKDENQLYDLKIMTKKCGGQELARYSLKLKLLDKNNKQIGHDTNLKVEVIWKPN